MRGLRQIYARRFSWIEREFKEAIGRSAMRFDLRSDLTRKIRLARFWFAAVKISVLRACRNFKLARKFSRFVCQFASYAISRLV